MEKSRRTYEPLRLLKDTFWGKVVLGPLARGNRGPYEDQLARCRTVKEFEDMSNDNEAENIGMMAMFAIIAQGYSQKDKIDVLAKGLKESINANAVAAVILAGRHIVHFHDDITQALSRSESAGMAVDDLNLPWDAFYIAFDGEDFIEGDYRLDGLSVHRDEKYLRITPFFDTNPEAESLAINYMAFEFGDKRDLLDVARQEVFGRTEEDRKFWKRHKIAAGIMQRHLPVFVNALLYLSAEPDAGETKWQDGAPAKLVAKASLEGRKAEKAERELHYSNWNKVRYIGSPAPSSENNKGNAPSAHWVRGHFRKQAYGKGRLERKIIWIRPHLSGGSAADIGEHADVRLIDSKS